MTQKNGKLKAFRAEYGIKQRDLANILGISVVTFGKKERNEQFNQKELSLLVKYARRYNGDISMNSLFFYE